MPPVDAKEGTVLTPAPPAQLSEAAQKKWTKAYTEALAQAKINHPENERAQRGAALRAANALLVVPAPKSADEIDALEDYQVLLRGTRPIKINGDEVPHRHCVTMDGRKYLFPIDEKADDNKKKKGAAATT